MGVPFDTEAQRGVAKVLNLLKRKHWPVDVFLEGP